jgi:hypothetical protein
MNDATDASASAHPCARVRSFPGPRFRLLVVATCPPVIDVFVARCDTAIAAD